VFQKGHRNKSWNNTSTRANRITEQSQTLTKLSITVKYMHPEMSLEFE